MPRLLALDWDNRCIRVVAATVDRGGVRPDTVAVWPEEETLSSATAAKLGERLRERLKTAGLSGLPLLVTIGRAQVVLKEVRFPPVAPAEEAALVRFQAAKDLTESPEDVVIDYAPLPAIQGETERRALAMILRRGVVEAYQALARAAGVRLLTITPRSYGLAAALQRAAALGVAPVPPAQNPTAIMVVTGQWVELVVVQGEHVLLARALGLGPGLAGEIRRSLAVLAHQQDLASAMPLYLAARAGAAQLQKSLQETAGLTVHLFEPLTAEENSRLSVEQPVSLAAAVGLLHAWGKQQPPINFVRPKEPPPPAPSRKNPLLAAGVILGVLCLAGLAYGVHTIAEKKNEIKNLNDAKAELEEQFKLLGPDAKDIETLREWDQGSILWLDELYDLAARLPHKINLRLTSCKTEALGKRGPKSKYDARLTLVGIVPLAEEGLIHTFVESINHDGHCRASLERLKSGKETSDFTIKVDLAKQTADRFTTVLTVPPPPSRSRAPAAPAAKGQGGEP